MKILKILPILILLSQISCIEFIERRFEKASIKKWEEKCANTNLCFLFHLRFAVPENDSFRILGYRHSIYVNEKIINQDSLATSVIKLAMAYLDTVSQFLPVSAIFFQKSFEGIDYSLDNDWFDEEKIEKNKVALVVFKGNTTEKHENIQPIWKVFIYKDTRLIEELDSVAVHNMLRLKNGVGN
jgi:hypothetical protein